MSPLHLHHTGIGHGRSIYATDAGECWESGLLPGPGVPTGRHSPASPWLLAVIIRLAIEGFWTWGDTIGFVFLQWNSDYSVKNR